jgi:hypothetical protein
MAAYPIPNPQYGIYNPNNFSKQSSDQDALTIETGKNYFLQFPNAQTTQTEYLHSIGVGSDATFNGVVTFNDTVTYNTDIEFTADVLVDGMATVMDNLLCESTATITDTLTCEGGIDIPTVGKGLTFPDNTTQTTAFIEANYAQLNTDNTFLPTFTNNFNGNVNLNGITNGITQLSGNNSTLLATTAFVQDAVQVSGVQVTDSPLLWSGANTWQYNSGTPGTLPYSYPYGMSNIWNLSGGQGDCNIVANGGGNGGWSNAFRIYCVQNNQTGTQLTTLTPQFQLSNDGSAAFIRDGLNVNAQNITGIGALGGNGGNITCNSNLLIGTGNVLNMSDNNIIGLNNLSVTTGQTLSIVDGVTNIMTFNTSGINSYENITMNASNLVMNSNNITGINQLTGVGLGNISITSGLDFIYGSGLNMRNGGLLNIGSGSTAYTQLPTSNDTSIATTAYVTTAVNAVASNIPVYTTTTLTLTAGGSMTPVTVYTTCYTSGGYATFVSGAFSITLNNYFISLQLNWAAAPWNGYPPGGLQGKFLNAYCSTNQTNYSCSFLMGGAPTYQLQILLPTGAPTTNGTNYAFNLQSIGGIPQ